MSQNDFASRHIGISEQDQAVMLAQIGVKSIEELIDKTLPEDIRLPELPDMPEPLTEEQFARRINELAAMNRCYQSYIGQGWYGTHMPAVIQRNILENPVWYTSYTPYQAEISQGRLEALFVFQTMVCELTGLGLANCSLLDEATAAAEAAMMMFNLRSRAQEKDKVCRLFVDRKVFPQTLAVLRTRCSEQGIEICEGDYAAFRPDAGFFGAIVQYPDADGNIGDYRYFCEQLHAAGLKVAVATDLMALVLLNSPGSWGADIAFGSAQRFGLPMGYGGPTAAFFAAKDEYKRFMPGRIIGLSKDVKGRPAYRLALQSREQHIKREKATSNICTASALMADMAAMYAVWHGPQGLKEIAHDIHGKASYLNDALEVYGYVQENSAFFDTLKISLPDGLTPAMLKKTTESHGLNLHYFPDGKVGISLDETTGRQELETLIKALAEAVDNTPVPVMEEDWGSICSLDDSFLRQDGFLRQSVFHKYHSETDMMRYIKRLENKDISLTHSMIPLGSCTMKLNAAAEMLPLSRPEFALMHPLAPQAQAKGYQTMIDEVSRMLCALTGMVACSLQPNSGAAGEYAGLRVIREYFKAQGQEQRRLIMIPDSAHGTNPASARQAGFDIIHVCCDKDGNIDLGDWLAKAQENADRLAGCMITYPSTHGIFEPQIGRLCQIVHEKGGLVYMDGANMNAQVCLTSPGFIGADICHLNLHKTFAMPHGGGGPGMGPICCNAKLKPFLPVYVPGKAEGITVAAAPYGNVMLLPITYGYLLMMGAEGLRKAARTAILSANYLAVCLRDLYGIYYTGAKGYVGHELILDCHGFKETGIDDGDIAKRLMDFGFHAPTLSFPVHGTLMIEPTESESLEELDRFVQAMKVIREEIQAVAEGHSDAQDNPLKNAPHPEYELTADDWTHSYPRSQAAYPLDWVRENKFMIPVGRIDNAFGDRNLVATLD